MIKDKVVVRYVPVTDRLYDLTEFMVNSFLRPHDIKLLKNKHIEARYKDGLKYLHMMCYAKTEWCRPGSGHIGPTEKAAAIGAPSQIKQSLPTSPRVKRCATS